MKPVLANILVSLMLPLISQVKTSKELPLRLRSLLGGFVRQHVYGSALAAGAHPRHSVAIPVGCAHEIVSKCFDDPIDVVCVLRGGASNSLTEIRCGTYTQRILTNYETITNFYCFALIYRRVK